LHGSAFLNLFPARGWKHYDDGWTITVLHGSAFLNLFPARGWKRLDTCAALKPPLAFLNLFPARGWKHHSGLSENFL